MNTNETKLTTTDSTAVSVPDSVLDRMHALCADADGVHITDAASFQRADSINAAIRQWAKDVETFRKKAKEPYLQMGKAIDAKAKELTLEIKERTAKLSADILAYQRKAAEAERERERKQQQLIREQLEAEQAAQRQSQEADNRAAEAARASDENERSRIQAEADAARAKAEASAAEARMASEQINEEIERAPEEVKSKSVTTARLKVLVIHDRSIIPRVVSFNGEMIELMIPCEPSIRKLLIAGASIPGCIIREVESTRSL